MLLLGAVTFGLAALVVGVGLRPDPLLLARKQLGAGAVAGGTATAAAQGTSVLLAAGLATLGPGWSAALVAGSSLVTEAAPPEQRAAVQGAVDALMSLGGAAGGVAAGLVLAVTSYAALGGTAAVLTLPVLVLVVAVARTTRPHRQRGGSS